MAEDNEKQLDSLREIENAQKRIDELLKRQAVSNEKNAKKLQEKIDKDHIISQPANKTPELLEKIFGEKLPLLTTNKWKIGHTFGASGMLSIEMAILMLQNQTFIGVPFAEAQSQKKPLKKILVNAVGFGGNAVSVLLGL